MISGSGFGSIFPRRAFRKVVRVASRFLRDLSSKPCCGRIAEAARGRDDFAASVESNAQDAGRPPGATLCTAMAGGTLFRMATVEAALGCSLGVLRQQFPRIRRTRQHYDALKANLR